jgi:iron complex transport system permease protein
MSAISRVFIWLIIIPIVFFMGLKSGSIHASFTDIWNAIFYYSPQNTTSYIIVNLRVPRIVLAFLTGGALALSGYLLQSLVNNPLADSYILGTASGASLGVNLSFLGLIPWLTDSVFSTSIAAFIGAFGVTLLAVFIAYEKGNIMPSRLLLAGVALSSLMVAITSFLIFVFSADNKLKKVIFWSMGSIDSASWQKVPLLAITLFLLGIISILLRSQMSILMLGESRANSLGVNVVRLRWLILVFSSLLTAMAVSVAGPIGFIGLIVPHFVRALHGIHGKYNIIDTILIGGIFLTICDSSSKWAFPDISLPIGILTSFLGIPFFVYLLTKRNFRFN